MIIIFLLLSIACRRFELRSLKKMECTDNHLETLQDLITNSKRYFIERVMLEGLIVKDYKPIYIDILNAGKSYINVNNRFYEKEFRYTFFENYKKDCKRFKKDQIELVINILNNSNIFNPFSILEEFMKYHSTLRIYNGMFIKLPKELMYDLFLKHLNLKSIDF